MESSKKQESIIGDPITIQSLIRESANCISDSKNHLDHLTQLLGKLDEYALKSEQAATDAKRHNEHATLSQSALNEFLKIQEALIDEKTNNSDQNTISAENARLAFELDTLKFRLSHYKSSIPQHWEAENFCITEEQPIKGKTILQWKFENLYLDDVFFPELTFITEAHNKQLKLVIKRPRPSSKKPVNSLRWPHLLEGISDIEISTYDDPRSFRNKCSELSTTGFQTLKILNYKILNYVSSPYSHAPKIFKTPNFSNLLSKLSKLLSDAPGFLRYDQSSIETVESQNGYSALKVTLINANFENRQWQRFEFSFSTIDESLELFGVNPRLEFLLIDDSSIGTNGKITSDNRGSRYELRFAHPNIIDLTTWSSAAPSDQILLTSLIIALPEIIQNDNSSCAYKRIPKSAWMELALAIKSSLAFNIQKHQSAKN